MATNKVFSAGFLYECKGRYEKGVGIATSVGTSNATIRLSLWMPSVGVCCVCFQAVCQYSAFCCVVRVCRTDSAAEDIGPGSMWVVGGRGATDRSGIADMVGRYWQL